MSNTKYDLSNSYSRTKEAGGTKNYDVCVIGAGVTGLLIAKKLSGLGLKVALIEKNHQVANGPSTRNEGWLHRGTYHAQSIENRSDAIEIAKRCIYGHEQIKQYAPEVIEIPHVVSYAVIRNEERVADVVSRWDESGVAYENVSLNEIKINNPALRVENFKAAFKTSDVAINTRLLYSKLLHDINVSGSNLFLGCNPKMIDQYTVSLEGIHPLKKIECEQYVHTSGYGMAEFFSTNFNIDLSLRYWKSHLLVTPRLCTDDIFCIDPGETGLMNHDLHSVVGSNEDAIEVTEPRFDVIDSQIEKVINGVHRLFNITTERFDYFPVACLKVDMPKSSEHARSLGISISEPIRGHLCVLPGKMTEAPYVSDLVAHLIARDATTEAVALRPLDKLPRKENYYEATLEAC